MYIKVIDIQHTHNGKESALKTEVKEEHNNTVGRLYETIPLPDEASKYGLTLSEVDINGDYTGFNIETAPFIKGASNPKGDVCILTADSIYVCIDMTKEIENNKSNRFAEKLAEEYQTNEEMEL